MRNFLPIKGPGGRALTPKEKIALLVLGVTLVLCVLTMLAGESAYRDTVARNPVFAVVALLCRALGGGIVGFYGIVMVWSGLIYFRGERVADVAPVAGRLLASFGVLVGISGALGIGDMATAGALGSLVGGALGNTLGGTIGISLLLALMALGIHLSSQGAWVAMRRPSPAIAHAYATPPPTLESAGRRVSGEPPMPDDGDPTPDERTIAVTTAMEEIERSQGVIIVDVDPTPESEIEHRPSIGEEVEAAPTPAPETEEAEVQRGLREVSEALASETDENSAPVKDTEIPHPFTPAPSEAEAVESVEDAADEHDEEEEEDEESGFYEPTYELIEREVEPAEETGFAATPAAVADEDADEELDEKPVADASRLEQEAEPEADDPDDPYARGGLIKRLKERQQDETEKDPNRPYASFDWRGRPLD